MLLLAMLACQESRIPEDAYFYDVTVTASADTCHPDATEGYEETFRYAVFFDAERAEVYVGEELFALGSIAGCRLTYETVTFGQDTEDDGNVKWKLYGEADIDPGEGPCVEGDDAWSGTEVFEVLSNEPETLEPGCTYTTETRGTFLPAEG